MTSHIIRTTTLGVALVGSLFSLSNTAFAQQNAADILNSAQAEPPIHQPVASPDHALADRLARALEIHNNPGKSTPHDTGLALDTDRPADYPVATNLAARLHDHEIASAVEISRAESRHQVADLPTADNHPRADEIAQRLADYYASNGPATP